MLTEYGKRMRLAMAHAKINQKELVKRTGLAQSTVSSALNRSNGSSDTPAYAAACGVSALWLATGDGDMVDQSTESQSAAPGAPRPLATQDMAMALFNAYGSLVRVLHRNGAIDAADLANEIGNTLDHRRTRGIESAEQNQMLELVYKSVLQIEKHESDLKNLKADFEKKIQALRDLPGTGESK